MKKCFIVSILLIASSLSSFAQKNKDYSAEKIAMYQSNMRGKPFFVPLEIGEITPQGWLHQWAVKAANGITGHLDEYEDVYKYGWKGIGFKAIGTNAKDGTGWPIEQCSYWLDGATKLGYILKDTALIHKTSARLNMVVNGVLKGGETFIYWKPKAIVDDNFNNWGHALMGRALVSYYQATHNPKILRALVKVYSNYKLLVPTADYRKNLNDLMSRMRGSTNLDAMTETFLMSGNRAILDTIIAYCNNVDVQASKAIWRSLNPNKFQDENQQLHGVSFYEGLRVPAMMSLWSGNPQDIKDTQNFLNWGEEQNLLPFGVCTSQEFLSGIGSIRNVETCNVPTSMWSFLWMLRLTGMSNWCDKIENVFFNAGPAPVARDWRTMCYYQSPNRFDSTFPKEPNVPGKGDLTFTPYGHKVLCCVGNVNNTIPDYISNMWMATMDKGLAFTLYGPCRVSKYINGTKVVIDCMTDYPFNDKINIQFNASKNVSMPLYFRIPDWCKNASIVVNNKKMDIQPSNGFVKIDRSWVNGDKIVLTLPMTVNVMQGEETPYQQVSYFNSTSESHDTSVSNPYECVTYGPLLFSLPIKDFNPNKEEADQPYNYALNISPVDISKDVEVVKTRMPMFWTWQIGESPVCLMVKARMFEWQPTTAQPLPPRPVMGYQDATIKLVPYGCTKFRVSMFPVTKNTWNEK